MSKHIMKQLALTLGAGLAIASGAALAESTYGYNSAGTGTVTASARVTVTVAVPKLILLRVGADNTTVDTLAFTAVLNPGIPGGITAAAVTAAGNGNGLASGWNGTAPAFGAPTAQSLTAYTWTNSTGGGQLGLSTAVNTALAGITPADITVTPTAVAGTMPTHPANTTTNANFGTFARNTVHSATWAYSVSSATLAAAAAGAYSQTITYTATTL